MNTKRGVALIFILTSILVGVLAFWLTYRQGVSRNTTMVLIYLTAVLLGAFGTILLFSHLLDGFVVPVLDELVEDTLDDREAIKRGNITFVHVSGLLTILFTIGFAILVTMFSKFNSRWGPIPVFIPTMIVLGFATWSLAQSRWFNNKKGRTPPVFYIILLIGMILSTTLGIARTENLDRAMRTPVGEYDYDFRAEQAMYLASDGGMTVVDFSFGLFSGCDEDECLLIIILVLVIVATVILIAGSASIIHFWFFSGWIFLAGMWIIFIRELRVRPDIGIKTHDLE